MALDPNKIYEKITAASTQLMSGDMAPAEIDRVLTACLSRQQPVYISLPSDVVSMKCHRPGAFVFPMPAASDPQALAEALNEALQMLDQARQPVVIGDVELIRFKLQREFGLFLAQTGIPYVTMMLGKTVLSEHHPLFLGLFEGDRSRDYVRDRVESADHKLVEVFGGGQAFDVRTEGELEDALRRAAAADELVFIEIHTGRLDCPEALRSAGRAMAKTNQLG